MAGVLFSILRAHWRRSVFLALVTKNILVDIQPTLKQVCSHISPNRLKLYAFFFLVVTLIHHIDTLTELIPDLVNSST